MRDGYAEQATPVQQRQAEAQTLERRLADLINQAYGLTPAEVDLLWRTAPPRMPVGRPDSAATQGGAAPISAGNEPDEDAG